MSNGERGTSCTAGARNGVLESGADENHEIRSDLTGVYIGWTTFGNVDLSSVHGLETVQHEGPSTIGIDTLYRSHGNIPEGSLIVSDSDLREAAKRQAAYVTSEMVTKTVTVDEIERLWKADENEAKLIERIGAGGRTRTDMWA